MSVIPLFKYAGGKHKMLEKYNPFFQGLGSKRAFIDYFGGSGTMSLWMHSLYPHFTIVLNELNSEIYSIYSALKRDYKLFLDTVDELDKQYTYIRQENLLNFADNPKKGKEKSIAERKEFYYALRHLYTNTPDLFSSDAEKAAALYFMLKTNFNGIWQVRAKDGIYNTPFGNGFETKSVINMDALAAFRDMLMVTEIRNEDFRALESIHKKRAIHYFDPPYVNSYTNYEKGGFPEETTLALCALMNRLNDQGEKVYLSNKDADILRDNLPAFTFETFDVKYTAGRKNTLEGSKAVEILAHN